MVPSLGELLERLKTESPYGESCRELYRQVASGQRHPTIPPLPENVVKLACQAMVVLFNHVDSGVR